MALLLLEGFDYQTTTPAKDFGAGSNPGVNPYNNWAGPISGGDAKAGGQLGGGAFQSGNQGAWMQWYGFTPTAGPYIVGIRYNAASTAGSSFNIWYFYDSSGNVQFGLGRTTANKLILFRGSVANVVGTGATTIANGTWYTIEVMFSIGASVACTVVLNGNYTTPEIAVTGVNTQASGVPNVGIFSLCGPSATGGAGNIQQTVDDLYFIDTTGPAPNNDFLSKTGAGGTWRVETLFVTANDSVQFTPNTSTNASQVQETNSDNDTTFNSATGPAIDFFRHGALTGIPLIIYGVMMTTKMRVTDTTHPTIRSKFKSGSTIVNGATIQPYSVYQYINDLFVMNPDTGSAWATTDVNASKIGYERVS
jgi:hypothetical protein